MIVPPSLMGIDKRRRIGEGHNPLRDLSFLLIRDWPQPFTNQLQYSFLPCGESGLYRFVQQGFLFRQSLVKRSLDVRQLWVADQAEELCAVRGEARQQIDAKEIVLLNRPFYVFISQAALDACGGLTNDVFISWKRFMPMML